MSDGVHSATLEVRKLFELLVPQLAHIEATGPCVNMASSMVSGPVSLPTSYERVSLGVLRQRAGHAKRAARAPALAGCLEHRSNLTDDLNRARLRAT